MICLSKREIYLPDIVGGGYKDYWKDKKRYRVLKGGKGSKKSATTALNFIYRLMLYKESNLLVVRRIMNTHRDSTFSQLKWAQERLGVSHLWHNTVSPMEMVYIPTGQKILFRGFDDVYKLASTTVSVGTLCWCWVEEAYEIEQETDFDTLDLSVPRGNVPEGLFKQTTLTFNPWSERHWLKKRFFDSSDENVSTYTTNYLCNEFLDQTDRRVFENLKNTNYRRYAVAGLGEWGVSEGLIFDNWRELLFDVNSLGSRDGSEWQYRHFFGLDYGYTNDPTAFIAFAANPITRELFIYDEHYQQRMLNCDIAEMIKKKGYAKERIRADCAEPKSNDDLKRLGIVRIQPSVKGSDSVINGINALLEYRIYVHPRCSNTIRELSCYCWKKDTEQRSLNIPEDRNNHLMDALRYAFYDLRYFKPVNPKISKAFEAFGRVSEIGTITKADMHGEWE